MLSPILLIHGGAWAMPDGEIAAHARGIARALDAGYEILSRGGGHGGVILLGPRAR